MAKKELTVEITLVSFEDGKRKEISYENLSEKEKERFGISITNRLMEKMGYAPA